MGLAVARHLAAGGAHVVLNDRKAERAQQATQALHAEGIAATAVVADVSRPGEAQRLVDKVWAAHGRIDVLVNVVGGIAGPAALDFWQITDHDWDTTLRVNL